LDIVPGKDSSFASDFMRFGASVLFTADDGVHGNELWISDGTATKMVRNIAPGGQDSDPHPIGVVHGLAVVQADDTVHGMKLWVTDCNGPNTPMLPYINKGKAGSGNRASGFFKGALYFNARDGVHGDELWRTDGTRAGTVRVTDIFVGPGSSSPAAFVATT